ncbi:dynein regulatory complex protein 11, partial [Lampris incognitus]|uniref:dynein regulatory complex protein 11 n=1 Tax=Lampris incognitus TaxID=2546036 RepID=UPI0024B48752
PVLSDLLCLSSYGRMWAAAQRDLEDLLADENPSTASRPQTDRLQVSQDLATFYLKYLQIFRSLEAVYDQIVHPQKRRVVRHVLDGVMGRLLELKNEMVELEFSEFHYFNDMLQDLKLTPEALEIPIPQYFLTEKIQVLREREKMLTHILAKGGLAQQEPKTPIQAMSLEEAMQILQICERARQGRLRGKFMKEIRLAEKEGRGRSHTPSSSLTPDLAATCIQKVWRGYVQRKRTKRERLEEMIFLGMLPAKPPSLSRARLTAQQAKASRHLAQEQNEEEYQRALVHIKESVWATEASDIRETLQQQIRQWFMECRDATGKFPDFPDAEDGGSASIFAQKTPEQVAAEHASKQAAMVKKKKSSGKGEMRGGKDPKAKKKQTKGKTRGKKGKEEAQEEEKGWKVAPSSFLPAVMEGAKIYKDVWQACDESQNFLQQFNVSLVREEKRLEVEEEVRIQVDELMRQELKNLKMAVERDKGQKKKKKGKKGGNKMKKKTTKRKKKKIDRDLTADRTIESLYEDLILEGFLMQPMNIKLSDYIGEYSYLGTTLRQMDIEPMPSLSDIRQLIALYGILPLGSPAVHARAPAVRSMLLAGPAGVGKKMLVHAICTETGANLFNLSSDRLAGKHANHGGLQYLLHAVLKMEPKRLKRDVLKLFKSLKAEDRVLVVGTTRRPFDADLKSICKVYTKLILIPRPNYGSRLVLWRELLRGGGAELSFSLDLSSLAKVTDGYTPGHIRQAASAVLSPRRLSRLSAAPLTASEFIPALARLDPVFREEEEAFKMWYSKTPLGKKRVRAAKTTGEGPEKGTAERSRGQKNSKEEKSRMKKNTKKEKKKK